MNNSWLHELENGQVTHLGLPFELNHVGPSFVIPLVTSWSGANAQYVQRVNAKRKVIGFDLLDSVTRRVTLSCPYEVHLGGDEVYALLDPEGNPLTGTQRELTPLVQNWVREIKWPLLRMSFARFCGQDELAERSAQAAVREKTDELQDSEHAVLWFIDSVVMADLLSTLALARGAANMSDDLFSQYALSVVRRGRDLFIEIPANLFGLTEQLTESESRQLNKLLQLARRATGRHLGLKAASTAEQTTTRASSPKLREQVDVLISRLASLPRQEARLATVIQAILFDRRVGSFVLEQYEDRANFARTAMQRLRQDLTPAFIREHDDVEQIISVALRRAIREAFPHQKARLLLELAKVLSGFPLLASVIREATVRSAALQVQIMRDEILGHLGGDRP